MAFDFKKEPGRSAGGGNPFEDSGSSGAFSGGSGNSAGGSSNGSNKGAGFSFGGSGASGGSSFGGSGGGFQFGAGKKEHRSGAGFSNLPAKRDDERVTSNRSSRNHSSGRSQRTPVDIPWRLIIWVVLAITVFCLIVAYWDVIVYVFYKIVSMLVLLIVLILILKMLFRRK